MRKKKADGPDVVVPMQRRAIRSRESILAAAERVFAAAGLHGARIDEIARLAGVNKQRLYAYFGSKRGLYRHALLRVYARAAASPRLAGLSAADLPRMTGIVIDAFFEFHRRHPRYWRMLAWENLQGGGSLKPGDWAGIRGGYIRHIEQLYREGQRSGVFRPDVAFETYLMVLFATTYFYFSNQLTISRLLDLKMASRGTRETVARELERMLTKSIHPIESSSAGSQPNCSFQDESSSSSSSSST